MLKTNYADEQVIRVVPGKYEVEIFKFQLGKSSTGDDMIKLFYKVREDVDQTCKGGCVNFDNITANTAFKFNGVSKAVGLPEGKEFRDFKEWGLAIKDKCILLEVDEELSTKDNKMYPVAKKYYKTEAPALSQGQQQSNSQAPASSNTQPQNSGFIPPSDDGLDDI